MTSGDATTQVDRAELRQVVLDARAVVDAVDALAAQAAGTDAEEWARTQAQGAHDSWDILVTRWRAGDPTNLILNLRALSAVTVPMGDAPPDLAGAADDVRSRCDALATRYLALLRPLLGDEGFTASARAQLAQLMPQVMQEL